MTIFQLPELPPHPMPTDERLDAIDARLDVLIDGIREILADLAVLKDRIGGDL